MSLFASSSAGSFADLVARLRTMPSEAKMKGVLVRLEAGIGLARAEEIGRHLSKVREKGVPVVCHSHNYGNSTMMLAALSCDEIWVSPAGGVDTLGLAGQLIFGRALLDRLQVNVNFIQIGKFKGAKEPFTNTEASPEARGSLQRALSGIRNGWIAALEKGRGKTADDMTLEDGPHTAEEAKALGLIDKVGFYRDARASALARAGVLGRVDYFGGDGDDGSGLAEILSALAGDSGSSVPHVAIVRATGGITMRGSSSLFGGSGGITHAELSKVVRRLQRDDSVKAVVLRIDSPGDPRLLRICCGGT